MSSKNSEPPAPPSPGSPCIRRCCLDDADVCVGCGRTLGEILEWNEAGADRRWQILEQAAQRVRSRPR
ncbi:DUF1289 domain-containing protein [Pseudomonas solani]|uniref:DUF1289 domain-containing protein n=1 Tax=Pseudomonas solani TaxID=2731552 RepID=A0AAU7Y6I3_9PSED|nr:DUF1289 domain-containing protein [Pseudomonas solani]MDN4143651.1 DUF1289 domain-containing protein [Pseudomonas tohonis]